MKKPEIFVDADACPVKEEIVRVADRHELTVHFVSNARMRLPVGIDVRRVIVPEGPDAADDWIAENVTDTDIAITADIPLAARCLEKSAQALGPKGKPFTPDNIGMGLAMARPFSRITRNRRYVWRWTDVHQERPLPFFGGAGTGGS